MEAELAAAETRRALALDGPQVSSLHTLSEVRVWTDEDQLPTAEEEEAGGISFLKEQQWVTDFAVEPAREAEVARSVSAPGEIVPVDGALVQVSAPAGGLAAAGANRSPPSVGDFVRAGESGADRQCTVRYARRGAGAARDPRRCS